MAEAAVSPFNSALETGVRALSILVACYPQAYDLARLVQYDYLTVHSADADGPPSLHPPLPLRSGELLVRRGLIEAGLRLMMSRGLVRLEPKPEGLMYAAEESAGAFLDNLTASYMMALRERAAWVAEKFGALDSGQLDALVRRVFQNWTTEFQPVHGLSQGELFG